MRFLQDNIFMPNANSTIAAEIDALYYFILWASTVIFAIVVLGIIYFVFKYRNESVHDKLEPQVSHNSKVEFLWTFIPTVLIIIVFFWGAKSFLRMQIYPNDAKQIMVEASQYQFKFQYPYKDRMFGVVDSLVVPQGRPIRLIMTGTKNAFIHSFYVPNFRIKQDVMPNRYSQVWFQSDDIGTYDYYCTEYCGAGHSSMNGYVVVMSQSDYDDWYEKQVKKAEASLDLTGAAKGKYLYTDLGCAGCHSIKEDEIKIGPSFKGKWGWGKTVKHTDGSESVVDEDYVTRSIRYPGEKIVEGFTNQMNPDYVDLPQQDITDIIEFIKSLNEE